MFIIFSQGEVRLFMNTISPNNTEDMLEAPGDFTFVDQNGDQQLLETFGEKKIRTLSYNFSYQMY